MMLGKHAIKTWSTIQKSITLSSAEAELVAAVLVDLAAEAVASAAVVRRAVGRNM